MIVITGAAGFVGSCLVKKLNTQGYTDIILVDNFTKNKELNTNNTIYNKKIDRNFFIEHLHSYTIDFIIHIGARTDTIDNDNENIFEELNFNYSKKIWKYCVNSNIPLIYISSAATYGRGDFGYDDNDLSLIYKYKPLNYYAKSKNDFDKWVLSQKNTPPNWYGLKLFNVYGPNEYHKNRMSSVIFHTYNQIKETNKMKLFKSHNPNYKNGEQLRDFIYIKDVVDVIYFLFKNKPKSDIYNLGTGQARTFNDLVKIVFNSLNKKPKIEYIDMPLDIKNKYQYFTEAKMDKLRKIYNKPFHNLEDGITDYIKNYLDHNYMNI